MSCAPSPSKFEFSEPTKRPIEEHLPSLPDRALVAYIQDNRNRARRLLTQHRKQVVHSQRADALRDHLELNTVPDYSDTFPGSAPSTGVEVQHQSLQRNLELKQAVLKVIQAKSEAKEEWLKKGPDLTLSTRFVPTGLAVGLAQSLVDYYQQQQGINEARGQVLQALSNYVEVRQEILFQTTDLYHKIKSLKQRQSVLELNQRLGRRYRRVVRSRERHGLLQVNQTPNAFKQFHQAQEKLRAVNDQLKIARQKLNGYLNRPPEQPFDFSNQQIKRSVPEGFSEVVSNMNRHPKVFRIWSEFRRIQMELEEEQYDDLRADLFADFGTSSDEGGDDGIVSGFSSGARFRIPLYTLQLRENRRRKRTSTLADFQIELEQVKAQARQSIRTAFLRYHTVHRKVNHRREEVQQYQPVVKSEFEKNRLGTQSEILTLLELYRNYLMAYESTLTSRYGRIQEYLQFVRASGVRLDSVQWTKKPQTMLPQIDPLSDTLSASTDKIMLVRSKQYPTYIIDALINRGFSTVILSIPTSDWQRKDMRRFIDYARQEPIDVFATPADVSTSQTSLTEWSRQLNKFAHVSGAPFPLKGLYLAESKNLPESLATIQRELDPSSLPVWIQISAPVTHKKLKILLDPSRFSITGIVTDHPEQFVKYQQKSDPNPLKVYKSLSIPSRTLDTDIPYETFLQQWINNQTTGEQISGIVLVDYSVFERRMLE